jgi:hypothetical protein
MIRRAIAITTQHVRYRSGGYTFSRANNKLFYSTTRNDEELKEPEMPDNCCGNMCRDCVWNVYFDEMEKYQAKLKEKERAVAAATQSQSQDPATESMKAFMEMEKKLQQKQSSS